MSIVIFSPYALYAMVLPQYRQSISSNKNIDTHVGAGERERELKTNFFRSVTHFIVIPFSLGGSCIKRAI